MKLLITRPRAVVQCGFSLVETALALGIVAFALVALMALLPIGLTTFRTAIDTSVSAQIVQRIVADAEQSDFDLLLASAEARKGDLMVLPSRFFDDQGTEVVPASRSSPNSAESQRILYRVRVRASQPGAGQVDSHSSAQFTSLPSLAGQPRFNPRDTTFLAIQIANNPSGRELATDDALLWDTEAARRGGVSIVMQTAIVARNGYRKATKL
jgi:uncharacterized protein (TIGR02598 family)